MKPICQSEKRGFPQTDCFFQAYAGRWHGWDDSEPLRPRHNLGREYLIEAARERAKEMVVFGVILVAAAWPVIYMIITVVQLLRRGRPIDR